MYHTIVVGGGPAGMMAAFAASRCGDSVLLLEQNPSLGKKLLITGKGRCNITNNADISEFISKVPVNANFLYSAFYSFTNEQLLDLLHKHGLATKVERGERVFPVSDRSSDVLKTLIGLLDRVDVKCGAKVRSLTVEDGQIRGVVTDRGQQFAAQRVILATGGASYSVTGSRGDGYRIAQQLGHRVIPPKPSLVPMEVGEAYCGKLQGLSLKNVAVTVLDRRKREVYRDFGEMLFTHFGVSGPVILSASSHIRDIDGHTLVIDLKPALSDEQLDARLLRDFSEYSNRDFCNALDALLPKKMIPVIVERSGIGEHTKVHQITREQRETLVFLLKHFSLTLTAMRPIDEAIITSGGICVKEINPSTMESKLISGLYFCGELIDVDAYTGGYNLQIAFSTGFLAGSAGREVLV